MRESVQTKGGVLVVNRQQASFDMSGHSVQAPKNNGGNEGGLTVIRTKKLDKLIEHLHSIRGTEFTGFIKINFSQGNIGRIEKFEEILKS
jgi:hypothetical protein